MPSYQGKQLLGIDVETYDPDLKSLGPGWGRNSGHLCGISVSCGDNSIYLPLKHYDKKLRKKRVRAYIQQLVDCPQRILVGTNFVYDLGWLGDFGIKFSDTQYVWDISLVNSLLRPGTKGSLDELALSYLNVGKHTHQIEDWLAQWKNIRGDFRKYIWECPAALVGPYAESDAHLPVKIAKYQMAALSLEEKSLHELAIMENALLLLYEKMRRQGVSVDIAKAVTLEQTLKKEINSCQKKIKKLVGHKIAPNKAHEIASAWRRLGLPKYPLTPTGQPSFKADFLEQQTDKFSLNILRIRKLEKVRSTFVEKYILNKAIEGKLFPQFHPYKGEAQWTGATYGTATGRFSSSHPNLQNIPSRDKTLTPLVRGLYIPHKKGHLWHRFDYDQIEFRLLAHFARGKGAAAIRQQYKDDPQTDFHEYVRKLVYRQTGIKIDRSAAKTLSFGLIYGMRVPHLSKVLGVSITQGSALFRTYHTALPFAKFTFNYYKNKAGFEGAVTTLLGRRRNIAENTKDALNTLLQGSAADIFKAFMFDGHRSGLFLRTGPPMIIVHDEANFSFPKNDALVNEVSSKMTNCADIRVPLKVSYACGNNWAEAKDD